MVGFIKKLTKKLGKKCSEDTQAQMVAMRSKNVKDRMKLAKKPTTSKEILYYLAEKDPDPKVRKAVAENKALPLQVSTVLARDHDKDVRLILARRLVDLLPDLTAERHSQLYAFAVQALGTLALDEVLKVRVALSTTLKDHAHTPPKVAGQLARDVERDVSEPILKFCTALSDEDLMDILKTHTASWVLNAIACRDGLSGDLSNAVIDVEDVEAGTSLILNEGAEIPDTLLRKIIEKSKTVSEWQAPTASRKNLPMEMAQELALFVDGAVRDILLARSDFDAEMIDEISQIFQRRMAFMSEEEAGTKSAEERVKEMLARGSLNEQVISDALAARDREFLNYAIAGLANTDVANVEKVLNMKVPKPIVALCWKASLPMRIAFQMQKEIGHVQPKNLIYPKNGTDYPMTKDDLNWQLEFLGIAKVS